MTVKTGHPDSALQPHPITDSVITAYYELLNRILHWLLGKTYVGF